MNEATVEERSLATARMADHCKLSVVFVLPNLLLKAPVETNYVAILPDTDPRIQEIAKRSPAVTALINNFSDHHGEKTSVSVMVIHDEAPKSLKDSTALVSFRNVIAVSHVLEGWQLSIGSPNVIGTLFSDYFDFYPYGPTRDGLELLHIGHGLNSLDQPDGFRGQPYPELSSHYLDVGSVNEKPLMNMLLRAWVGRFEKGRKDWSSNRLFRSLAVAYHASGLPKRNNLWFYDFGVSVALWVSAFEILTHPGQKGRSDLPRVLDLLSKARFSDPILKQRRRMKVQNQPRDGNATEYLYWKLYKSRNAFLHGNPVTAGDALYKNKNRHHLLTAVAPVIFAVALLCHFDWFSKPHKDRLKVVAGRAKVIDVDWQSHFSKRRLEKVLKHILTGKDRRLI